MEDPDDDDLDFEPLPTRPSQVTKPGERTATYSKKSSGKTPVRKSAYFSTPKNSLNKPSDFHKQTEGSQVSTPFGTLSQRRLTDNFKYGIEKTLLSSLSVEPSPKGVCCKNVPVRAMVVLPMDTGMDGKNQTNLSKENDVPFGGKVLVSEQGDGSSVPISDVFTSANKHKRKSRETSGSEISPSKRLCNPNIDKEEVTWKREIAPRCGAEVMTEEGINKQPVTGNTDMKNSAALQPKFSEVVLRESKKTYFCPSGHRYSSVSGSEEAPGMKNGIVKNSYTDKNTSGPSLQITSLAIKPQCMSLVPGSSPANPLRIEGLIDKDDIVISSLQKKIDRERASYSIVENAKSIKAETFDDVVLAAEGDCLSSSDEDYRSPSNNDIIEGSVGVLGDNKLVKSGYKKKTLCKAVDRSIDGSSTLGMKSQNGARVEDAINRAFSQGRHIGYKTLKRSLLEHSSSNKHGPDSSFDVKKLDTSTRHRSDKTTPTHYEGKASSKKYTNQPLASGANPGESGYGVAPVVDDDVKIVTYEATFISGNSYLKEIEESRKTCLNMENSPNETRDHVVQKRVDDGEKVSDLQKPKSGSSPSSLGPSKEPEENVEEPLWAAEFESFTGRKSNKVSQARCSSAKAALDALKLIAAKGQIQHVENIPARPASYAECAFKLPPKLRKAVRERGIDKFYSHQAEAMNKIFNGSSIVAATPTASGKSMTYIIPVLDSLMKMPKSRALFIFPVKALARDQLKTLCELFFFCGADLVSEVKKGSHCYCYDGDTNTEQKSHIRKTGKIIITNPDMLHFGILSHHKLWENFFSNLKFVVLDEAHTYRGVFGSHVGCILRRLLRIARHYGSEPMFVCCSATIGNPKEHVKMLTTMDVEVINGTGAPSGEKHVVCWLPPETKTGERRSAYKEAVKIVVALIKAGLQTLVFVEARKLAEIVCRLVREKLVKQRHLDLVEKVDSYRAGYTPEERITLEKRLQNGQLRALVTTRALELGIDVGDLDATVHVGLPNTMCGLWQQAGRAGRRQGASLAVIVGQERPLDVFYMKNPDKLFGRDVEHAFCNPCNPQLLRLQLPCAARELPLSNDDEEYFGAAFEMSRDDLVAEGVLQYRGGARGESLYEYRYDDNPAFEFSIRGTSSNCFQLLTGTNTLVEEVDGKMALRMLYEGAIYPHARDTYRSGTPRQHCGPDNSSDDDHGSLSCGKPIVTIFVRLGIKRLDIEGRRAFGDLCDVHHITEVNAKTTVVIMEKTSSRTTAGTRIHLGKLQVKEQVMGYSEIDVVKNKVVDNVTLKYPPSVYETIGVHLSAIHDEFDTRNPQSWWDIPAEVMQKLKNMAYDALLVLKRITLSLLPPMTMSDPTDILGLETLAHEQTEQPQIFVYDAYAGGIGLAEQAYKDIEEAWTRGLNVLQTCDCKYGCPSCTQGANDSTTSESSSSKHAALTLLEALLPRRQASLPPALNGPAERGTEAKAMNTKGKEGKDTMRASGKVTKTALSTVKKRKDSYLTQKSSGQAKRVTANLGDNPIVIDLS